MLQWTDKMRRIRIVLVLVAVAIAVASLFVSHTLVRDLSRGERNNMEVWAEAMSSISNGEDMKLALKVIEGNNTIPVVVLYSDGEVYDYRNIDVSGKDSLAAVGYVHQLAGEMKRTGNVIRIDMDDIDDYMEVCFDESVMIHRLAVYPYIQLAVVLIFMLVVIYALMSSKRAEQNKVWVGLSKETAHQLGTPISSLMAWVEVLRESYPEDELIPEMDKDVKRLQRIAERFSKIGSLPEPQPDNLNDVIDSVVTYIRRRTSNKVDITAQLPEHPLIVRISAPLFEWVVENLCKNAIDAMEGQGSITLVAREEDKCYAVEVTDTGKGIAKRHFKTVFSPGFTTKKRGWGLGLSLAKRIVEEYHHGRIFVKNSELGWGTTFRIELKKH